MYSLHFISQSSDSIKTIPEVIKTVATGADRAFTSPVVCNSLIYRLGIRSMGQHAFILYKTNTNKLYLNSLNKEAKNTNMRLG